MNFQNSLQKPDVGSSSSLTEPDTDDVYYRFGGAAICDMLCLQYEQLKSCSDNQQDKKLHYCNQLTTKIKQMFLDTSVIVSMDLFIFQTRCSSFIT